jgi:hypothetical protein
MASKQPIIQGALIDAPGRYELCWINTSESGEVSATTRNVVVEQHGAFFYMQFADAEFQPYECGHEGLRCDLLDPSVAWLRPVAVEIRDDEVLQAGDIVVSRTSARYWSQVSSHWIGKTAQSYLDSFCVLSGAWRVLRPVDSGSAVMRAAEASPGLQATG